MKLSIMRKRTAIWITEGLRYELAVRKAELRLKSYEELLQYMLGQIKTDEPIPEIVE